MFNKIIGSLTLVAAILGAVIPFYFRSKDKADNFIKYYRSMLPESPDARGTHDIRRLLEAGICDLSHSDICKTLEEIEKRFQYNSLGWYKDKIWPFAGCFFKKISTKILPPNDDISGKIQETINECNVSCLQSKCLERLKKKVKGCKCPIILVKTTIEN